MPSADFIMRSGKYAGKTYEWVCRKNPSYIAWVKKNQPSMLKEKTTKVINVKEKQYNFGKLTPNPNFENEGPDEGSLEYFKKINGEN